MILTGQGPIYVGEYDPVNGKAASGYLVDVQGIGCANTELSTTFARQTKKIKESCSGSKLDFAELETEKSAEVTLTMINVVPRMLAAAMGGTLTDVTGSTVTGEAFPPVVVGDVVSLKYTNVSSVVITDSATPSPATLVAGTNYTVLDAANGLVQITNLGSFVQPFVAAYTYAAHGNLTAFTQPSVERGLIYSGINTHDGLKYKLVIPRISLALDGTVNWLSAEEAPITLKGSMLYVPEFANDTTYGPFMRVAGDLLA